MKSQNKIQFKQRGNDKMMAVLIVAIIFLLGFHFGSKSGFFKGVLVVSADTTEEQDKKIDKTEDKIHDLKKDLKKTLKKKEKDVQAAQIIEGGINVLIRDIANIEEQISRTENTLEKLKNDIEQKEKDISSGKKKMALVVRRMNRQKIDLKMTVLDSNKGLQDYIKSRDTMENLQRSILNNLKELKEQRRALEKVKEEKDEAKDVLDSQKSGLQHEKIKKSWLLGEKKKDISKHDEKIQGIQRKIDSLKSTLSSFLGKSFNAKDIVEAVKFASKKTGVRKEFLMAMLDKETDLGRFTGGCTYKNTRIRSNDKKLFKQICKSLGYNYKKKKISCSLSYGYGGAMGVAQFMPATWMGYKARIAARTHNNPPDPWDLGDGIMAMALYLKDKGGDSKGGEYEAAARYYCGGNWKRPVCYNYANTVKSWAKGGYEEYF